MVTDPVPRRKDLRKAYEESDRLADLELPPDGRLPEAARTIEQAMKTEDVKAVQRACAEFLKRAARFYKVKAPEIEVLEARPLRVREGWALELFGDYHPETKRIRVWMRTAVRRRITSFGTFLSTLCHEFCHHLDFERYGFPESYHTRGFYERAGALYHHARATARKRLYWNRMPAGRWRIDWQKTRKGG